MRARITHEHGTIRLHSDGPWEELAAYEVAELVRQAMSALQGKMLFEKYPPATRYWEEGEAEGG
ncbi:hypothetical protein LB518_22645 [Mesorhizobium sp. BR1-1-16]|uniref:hypothetical protein n=1 Tax=Mesorhizobium sp. BR1-1-16 TaxID=2876653 RepID=UPI001CD008BC|nr:hypothetical protein [Mesorhizobium sp. BR1-1-16]MBZ9939113.1 hypothetical protein [Mesorhizobium sp. BR1-1-16]